MPAYEVTLLGGFEVRVDGRPIPVEAWRHTRAAELVKILALADGNRLHREHVIDLLWPELDPAAGAANLRKAVHFARTTLGAAQAIDSQGGLLRLCPGTSLSVDAQAFEVAARCGRITALDVYRGDLLPEDRYAAWAAEPRERLRARYVALLKSARQWERVLQVDPADEEAHRALMRRALDAGDRATVVRQFQRLRDQLRADLGVGPDAASVALYERAVAAGTGVPAADEHIPALLARGLIQLNTGELAAAETTAQQARSMAIDAGLGRETGEASALLGTIANLRGQWKQRFRGEFSAAVQQPATVADYTLDAHLCLAESCLHGPNGYREMADYARELLAIADNAGSVRGRALAELLLGQVELFSGRLPAAHRLLTSAVRGYQRSGARSGAVLATHRLAEVALAAGRRAEAGWLLRRGARLADGCWLEPHLTVRIHGTLVAAAPTPAAAVRRVEQADDVLSRRNVCAPCSMGFRIAAVTAYARAGRLDQARRRLHTAEQLAGIWPAGSWHAAVWEARAELRLAEGDVTRAAALFDEAADQFAEVGRPVDRDRCRAVARRVR